LYSDRWSPGLRQGDVIGEIFFPSLAAQVQTVTTTRSLIENVSGPIEVVQVGGDRRYGVVLSHDCEFNEAKRNRLLVARVEGMPGNLGEEEIEGLRASNDVRAVAAEGKDVDGVDSFVLDPIPGVFDELRIAAFTTATPFSMKMKDGFVSVKGAEMAHEHRVLFREKLAWFFGRHGEDIDDAMKFDAPPTTGENEESEGGGSGGRAARRTPRTLPQRPGLITN
jgi:hypothetical protein